MNPVMSMNMRTTGIRTAHLDKKDDRHGKMEKIMILNRERSGSRIGRSAEQEISYAGGPRMGNTRSGRLTHHRKWAALLLLPAIGCMLMTGCGSSDTGSSVSLSDLQTAMLAADEQLPEMTVISGSDENASLNFTSLCDFDYENVEDYFYAYATDGTAPEIAVVEVKDSLDIPELMDDLKEHVEQRKGTMEAYSPDQVTLVENYVLTSQDQYVTLIISPQNGLVQNAFKEAFQSAE